DADRYRCCHRARDQAVPLHRAQRLGEHLLADTGDDAVQFGVPARSLRKRVEYQADPLVADPGEQRARRAAGHERVIVAALFFAALRGGPGRHVSTPLTPASGTHSEVRTSQWRVALPTV